MDQTVQTEKGTKPGASITMGDPYTESKPVVTDAEANSQSVQFDDYEKPVKEDDNPATDDNDSEDESDKQTPTDTDDDVDQGEGDEQEGDTESDALTEQQSSEISERILDGDSGQLNKDALTAEFDANEGKGLNDDTYKFLAEKFGVSKEMAQDIEAGLISKRSEAVTQSSQAMFDVAGGPDALAKALEWGKNGGYNEAEQKRFNDVTKGSDQDAQSDAVGSLMYRYNKSNPTKVDTTKPQRDITQGASQVSPQANSLKPFESRADYRVAMRKAKNNPAAQKVAARRLAVSKI